MQIHTVLKTGKFYYNSNAVFVTDENTSKGSTARTHELWTHEMWSPVMLTEESCFFVRPKKNCLYVRRSKGRMLHEKYMLPSFKSGYQTVSILAAFQSVDAIPLL